MDKKRQENKKPLLFFYFLKNECGCHRFAISVKKKIGSSVERNFIKRKMRELFRTNQHLVERKHDFWIVMKDRFVKKNAEDIREVEDLFLQALRKMNRSYDSRDK